MPKFDRTGPQGVGPMTGKGLGPCGMGIGWRQAAGRGRGLGQGQNQGQGRGLCRYFWGQQPRDSAARKLALEGYREALTEELEDLEAELASLGK